MSASPLPADPLTAAPSAAVDPDRLGSRLFTIGHSNHELDRFLNLLHQAGVTAVADVRSSPFSRRLAQFNQPEFRRALEQQAIGYVYLGDELGGRPRNPELYDADGRVDYWRIRDTAAFNAGLERLSSELEKRTVALTCAEEDPLDCHRALMVCAALVEQGIRPRHVRGDGSIETTLQFEARLLDETGVGRGMLDGLFAASVTPEERAELLEEAYKSQARRRAFRLPPGGDVAAIGTTEEFSTE
jgi:hypothetical protein